MEHARAVQPYFVADDAYRDICRRLDGIPLALEMAAARLRSMQPQEISARLNERLRFLVGGRRATGRQQTLRAAVAWSHDLLDERERRVFRRLAVFAGSFGLDAAEAVAVDDDLDVIDVDDVLGSLVAKSLVVADPSPDGTTRYRLFETLRQYAQEQLDAADVSPHRLRGHDGSRRDGAPTEHTEARDRLLSWAAAQARRHQRLAAEGGQHRAAMEFGDLEQHNLRAALDWATESGSVADGLIVMCRMDYWWKASVHTGEAWERLLRLLERSEDEPVPERRWLEAVLTLAVFATVGRRPCPGHRHRTVAAGRARDWRRSPTRSSAFA